MATGLIIALGLFIVIFPAMREAYVDFRNEREGRWTMAQLAESIRITRDADICFRILPHGPYDWQREYCKMYVVEPETRFGWAPCGIRGPHTEHGFR